MYQTQNSVVSINSSARVVYFIRPSSYHFFCRFILRSPKNAQCSIGFASEKSTSGFRLWVTTSRWDNVQRRHLELVSEARGCLEDGQSKDTAAHRFADRRHSWLDRKRMCLGHRLVALGPPTGLVRVNTLGVTCAQRFAVDIYCAHMLIAREV